MKKILFLIVLVIQSFLLSAQDCSDLIISEVVFGIDTTEPALLIDGSLGSRSIVKNYSVELFNPTDLDIDLSNYSIKLTPQSGSIVYLYLSGTIVSKQTYVISNSDASASILALSNVSTVLLDYDNKSVLELFNDTNLLDKVGQLGLSSPDAIILASAIADPMAYLSSLSIDLSSLKELTFRRNPSIQHGNLAFSDLSHEWYVFSNNDISNLDIHSSVCVSGTVTVGFDNPNRSTPEGYPLYDVKVNALGYDGTTSPSVFINAYTSGTPSGLPARSYFTDWSDGTSIDPVIYFTSSSHDCVFTSSDDPDIEQEESAYFQLSGCFDCNIDYSKQYQEVRLIDNDGASIHSNSESDFVSIFPNPTSEYLYLRLKVNNQKVNSYKLLNSIGETVFNANVPTTVINVTRLASGLYTLLIQIDNQILSKRVIIN